MRDKHAVLMSHSPLKYLSKREEGTPAKAVSPVFSLGSPRVEAAAQHGGQKGKKELHVALSPATWCAAEWDVQMSQPSSDLLAPQLIEK